MAKKVSSEDLGTLKNDLADTVDEWYATLPDIPVDPPPPASNPETLTLTPGNGSIKADWTFNPAKSVLGTNIGRDGSDSTGAPAWSTTEPSTVTSRTFDKLLGTVYTITAVISYSDGSTVTLTKQATPTTAPEPPASGTTVPKAGKSGFMVNSLRFSGQPTSASALAAAGADRGMPFDGPMFFVDRSSWAAMRQGWNGNSWAEAVQMLNAGMVVVCKLPHAPESEGGNMNQNGANNTYRAQQMSLAADLVAMGANRSTLVMEIDWECNGDWYQWSCNKPGGKAALKAARANCMKNFRDGGLTNVKFGLCLNMPSVNAATWSDFYVPGYDQVLSIDQYDMWNASYTQDQWNSKQSNPLSMEGAAKQATIYGIQWGLSEGGNVHGSFGGGDNPKYWEFVHGSIKKYKANCAYHVTYDQPGSDESWHHDFAHNPQSYIRYKQLWIPGA